MQFEVTSKEHGSTVQYFWLTLQPKDGAQDVEITVIENTDHTTGYTDHEVIATEGIMPESEQDMETEEEAIEYVKANIGEILKDLREKP